MKFFLPLFFLCATINAQLLEVNPMGVTESTFTPEQLIRNVLVSGACANANVSNVSAVVETANDPTDREGKSYGYFRRPAGSSFPFAEGIILTSGRAYQAGNVVIPRENPLSENSNGNTTDADLIASTGGGDFGNTTSFQFNFTTSSDQISFRYIMASEEYAQTFPCSFADSFAFLLKPAASGTYENIALIPGTTTPISVVNVRPDIPGTCGAQNEEYFEGYNVGDTNYNGRTVVLTATASVTPNTEYTIKLVIADSVDSEYDSAVFLESGSFNLGLDLGDDFSIASNNAVCGATSQLLTANVTAPTYKWYKDGVEILGETDQTYLANLGNGVYTCEIPNGTGCAESDDILVEFVDGATINPTIANILECDTDGDLVVNFNFRDKDTEILNGQDPADFEVQYFTDSAYTAIIPDPTNYTNTNAIETIYARVVNRTSTNCVADNSFTIQVIGEPTPTAPSDYIACDNASVGTDIDGFTNDTFLLNTKDTEILGTLDPADYTVTYHTTLLGAQTSSTTDVIDKTINYQNTTAFTQTVYIRVENNLDANCNNSALTMDLVVVPQPKSNAITNILSCSTTGTEVFDLHALKDAEMLA
ncbi:choice-of-anchor L domain-containing protein, partial [Flavobacteriaceae bacterium S356]|nr:choice-of-anchor L domain-containing protein [Flavobacteriaceae bacterium S356]